MSGGCLLMDDRLLGLPRVDWRDDRIDCPTETPFFTVDRSELLRNVANLRAALPGVSIFYAVKANPEPAVLRTLAAADVNFEIASLYELHMVQDLGLGGDRVIYGTAVKPVSHIQKAFQAGVRQFAADSIGEIDKLASAAPGANVHIRVRVNDADSVYAFGEKFGATPEEIEGLVTHALAVGLHATGLSFHVGSQSTRPSAWAEALSVVNSLTTRLRERGVVLETVNIGGGFPAQYAAHGPVPTVGEIGRSIDGALEDFEVRPALVAEPGRYLVASAASLTVSVISRVNRQGVDWLFVDAGCYNGLFEAMAYQGGMTYPVTYNGHLHDQMLQTFCIAGPTGDSADVVARNVLLPADIAEGDRLTFTNVGAYTMSMAVPFNGFPKPTVHVI